MLDSFVLAIALFDGPIVFQLRNELAEVRVAYPRSHEPSAGLCRGPELVVRVDSAQKGSAGEPACKNNMRGRVNPQGLLGKGRPRARGQRGLSGLRDLPA